MKQSSRSKLYTRSGDAGQTSLFGGGCVSKDHPSIEAYGSVDELNAALGVAVAFLRQRRLTKALQEIQNELFNIGSELTSETGGRAAVVGHLFLEPEAKIVALERLIDQYDAKVEPLRTFILPSGTPAGTLLHLCRTVCRRAERAVVRLSREEPVNPAIVAYLNRLSDLLFALARYVNKAAGKPEIPWSKG